MRCILSGEMELALQIFLSHLNVPHRHAEVFVSHQLHECGKANAETDHFRSERMAELVRRCMRTARALAGPS